MNFLIILLLVVISETKSVDCCKLPSLPEYATVRCSSDGSTCKFNCMPGTVLIGQLLLTCNQNTSKWDFPLPSCKVQYPDCLANPVIKCHKVEKIKHDGLLKMMNLKSRSKRSIRRTSCHTSMCRVKCKRFSTKRLRGKCYWCKKHHFCYHVGVSWFS